MPPLNAILFFRPRIWTTVISILCRLTFESTCFALVSITRNELPVCRLLSFFHPSVVSLTKRVFCKQVLKEKQVISRLRQIRVKCMAIHLALCCKLWQNAWHVTCCFLQMRVVCVANGYSFTENESLACGK